jgi:hypothetical protein
MICFRLFCPSRPATKCVVVLILGNMPQTQSYKWSKSCIGSTVLGATLVLLSAHIVTHETALGTNALQRLTFAASGRPFSTLAFLSQC